MYFSLEMSPFLFILSFFDSETNRRINYKIKVLWFIIVHEILVNVVKMQSFHYNLLNLLFILCTIIILLLLSL